MALQPDLQIALEHVRSACAILEKHALKPVEGLEPRDHRRELERRLFAIETVEQSVRWIQRLDSDLDDTISAAAHSRFATSWATPDPKVH